MLQEAVLELLQLPSSGLDDVDPLPILQWLMKPTLIQNKLLEPAAVAGLTISKLPIDQVSSASEQVLKALHKASARHQAACHKLSMSCSSVASLLSRITGVNEVLGSQTGNAPHRAAVSKASLVLHCSNFLLNKMLQSGHTFQ
jgi:hypothetical protein